MECCCWCAAAYIIGAYILFKILDYMYRKPRLADLGNKYIFVTGCDTGFGHETAKQLDSLGCHVFAGCLTEIGQDNLRKQCSSRLKVLHLDVSSHSSVLKAAEEVKKHLPAGRGLWGILNNAGVAGRYMGPVEFLTIQDYKDCLGVNLYGLIDVTVTLLPLLKRERGRVVNTASVFGRVSLLGNTPYSVSKFGVEAFSDELRREMRPFKCSCHIIEPGFHKTNISSVKNLQEAFQRTWDRLSPELKQDYGEEFRLKSKDDVIAERIQRLCSEKIQDVVDGYIHALLAKRPRARYLIGRDAKFFWMPLGYYMPEWLGDKMFELIGGPNRPIPAICKK